MKMLSVRRTVTVVQDQDVCVVVEDDYDIDNEDNIDNIDQLVHEGNVTSWEEDTIDVIDADAWEIVSIS